MQAYRPSLVLIVLLALLIAAWGPPGSRAPWQGQNMTAAAAEPEAKAKAKAKQDEAKQDKAAREEAELQKMMEHRRAVRAFTRSGKSILQAPPFEANTREDKMEYFPCSDCHESDSANPHVRVLSEEHEDLVFEHGGGRYWCYDVCHNSKDMDHLVTFRGQPISYNESYKLCGQCHFQRQKDWYFGGHGKRMGAWPRPYEIPLTADELKVEERDRIGTWQGERMKQICPDCHNPHSPSIKGYEPSPPPGVRIGLAHPSQRVEPPPKVWNRETPAGEAKP